MLKIFDDILGGGELELQRLVDEKTTEAIDLDFKNKVNPTKGMLEKEDRPIIAKLISGFANSAGGLGIWGIDARPNPDGVDCAVARMPIADIDRFHSDLQSQCWQFIMPRHDGIRIEKIVSLETPGAGYILLLVDRSERRPHRVEVQGDKNYYKRSLNSFVAMEHYDIEDAFRRVGSPLIRILYRQYINRSRREGFDRVALIVDFGIENFGATACQFPYLRLALGIGVLVAAHGSDGNGGFGLPRSLETDGSTGYYGGSDHILHPGRKLQVTKVIADYFINPTGQPQMVAHPEAAFSVNAHAGGLNARDISRNLTIGYSFLESRDWTTLDSVCAANP